MTPDLPPTTYLDISSIEWYFVGRGPFRAPTIQNTYFVAFAELKGGEFMFDVERLRNRFDLLCTLLNDGDDRWMLVLDGLSPEETLYIQRVLNSIRSDDLA